MRGYTAGMQHIRCGLQLKVLRQRSGLSLSAVSAETGLEPELITWIEENDYTKLVDFDYKRITDILFDYYGVDQQAGTFYVRFDKLPIKIKPCNGFHPIDKVPAKSDTQKNPLYTIQEPKYVKKTLNEPAEEGNWQ